MKDDREKLQNEGSTPDKRLPQKVDVLTVFQASPLAYLDLDGNINPVGMLDFEHEREILKEALKEGGDVVGAKVHLVFEIATTNRLGAFLAKGRRQLLHFSCHGDPDYLFVENDQGGGQVLLVEDLREWIKAGKKSLRFVFVSACHSRSAGEAFLEAGVPHVVCCQHDSQQLADTAAVEFARAFYRALANGKTLKEAFELGRNGVRVSPNVADARTEMNNFALLPEGKDHDVHILYAEKDVQVVEEETIVTPTSLGIPLPPQPRPFLGRELEMYKILQALKSESRLVRVTGPPGIGKHSVVLAVCHFINHRRQIFSSLGEIYWLPSGQGIQSNELLSCFAAIFEEFDSPLPSWSFSEDDTYKVHLRQTLEALHLKRVLIVVDARKMLLSESLYKLCTFLEDILQGTEHAKVIAIRELAFDLSSPTVRRFSTIEKDIEVPPLDFESTVLLFGALCRHVSEKTCPEVSNTEKLCELLVPPGQGHLNAHSTQFSKRSRSILQLLGDGKPDTVHRAAKGMTEGQYQRLIAIGQKKEIQASKSKFQTRAKLEERLSVLAEETSRAVREKDFGRAEEFQVEFDELERLREELPDLQALEDTENSLARDLDRAIYEKNFKMAANLQTELDSITSQIKIEKEALPSHGSSSSQFHTDGIEDGKEARKPPPVATRAALEVEIQKQKAALDTAFEGHKMDEVRHLDQRISQLESRRLFFPTSAQIRTRLNQFNSELKKAKRQKDWDRSESLMGKIQELETKLELEIAAEADADVSFGDQSDSQSDSSVRTSSDKGESAVVRALQPSQSVESRKSTPSEHKKDRGKHKIERALNDSDEKAIEPTDVEGTPETLSRTTSTPFGRQSSVRPGAVSIPGPTEEVEVSSDAGTRVEVEAEVVDHNLDEHDSVQERIERTIENMAVPSRADVVPAGHLANDVENQPLRSSLAQDDERLLKLVGRLALTITCMIVTVILVTSGVVFLFIKLA